MVAKMLLDRSPLLSTRAVGQGERDPGEGAAGGGEVAAGVDLDVGGDAGAAPGEGGVGDGERAVDGDPFRVRRCWSPGPPPSRRR